MIGNIHLAQIEELLRERKHGKTLKQKIDAHLEKVKKKDLISHIGDGFFHPVEENGIIWQLRRVNLQRDNGRTLNIVDEIEEEEAKQLKIQEEEAKRDLTFEEFEEQFLAHMDGTAPNERDAHESEEEVIEEKKKSEKPGT